MAFRHILLSPLQFLTFSPFHLFIFTFFYYLCLRQDRMRFGNGKSKNFVFHLPLRSPFIIFASWIIAFKHKQDTKQWNTTSTRLRRNGRKGGPRRRPTTLPRTRRRRSSTCSTCSRTRQERACTWDIRSDTSPLTYTHAISD